jgi:hypothetical protein
MPVGLSVCGLRRAFELYRVGFNATTSPSQAAILLIG